MNDYLQLFETRKLVLIMSLPCNEPALCRAAFDAGADAVKVHINVEHRASGTHFGRLAQECPALETMLEHRRGPMGLVLGGSPEAVALDALEARLSAEAFRSWPHATEAIPSMKSGKCLPAAPMCWKHP